MDAHEMMVRDDEQYRRTWLVAHGYLPDPCPPPPRDDIHLCGSRGFYITGSRRDCPHCKIAAPGRGQ